MKRNFYIIFLGILLSPVFIMAQTDRFAYAITDLTKEGANWSFLRRIDLQTGSFSDVLLSGNNVSQLSYDATSKKQMTAPMKDLRYGEIANAAFGTGVAAIAYDKKNERLYYTPMFFDQLRYVDLRTMKVFFVNDAGLTGEKVKAQDQSNIVTRMVIASDGNGYALTNDGNHLVRFTTGKKTIVTDLGALTDDPANNNVSIHNSCSSYGGDMIADDDGNLFILSARNHVFKVQIDSKVATHLGIVTDLPPTFTINGAAVDNNGQILLTSAVDNTALYTLNINTLKVTPTPGTIIPWRTADLANSNLLATRKKLPVAELIKTQEETADGRIQLYPNPVIGNSFRLQFAETGDNYSIQVTDVLGRQTLHHQVNNLQGKGQTQTVELPNDTKKGVYLVKVVDQQNKTVFSKKILVQ